MIEFVREMNKNYLKVIPEIEDSGTDYMMKMLENNTIEGLLSMHSVNVNNKVCYLYDISGRIPLEEMYLTKEFSAADIGYFAGFIREIIAVADRYMLDLDGIVFDKKYIFCAVSENAWSLVYNSGMAGDARSGLKRVFEFILSRLDHRDRNAVILGYGLYKRVCQEEISIADVFDNVEQLVEAEEWYKETSGNMRPLEYELKEKINKDVLPEYISEEQETEKRIISYKVVVAVIAIVAGMVLIAAAMAGVVAAVITFALTVAAVFLLYRRWGYKATIHTKDTAVPCTMALPVIAVAESNEADQEEPTMLITSRSMAYLRRMGRKGESAEEFVLNDSPLSIGSGAQADIVIKDKGISRFHARISREGEMFFIKDMNSTNGTWVNDRRLTVYELCPVRNKDVIRLAESRFELIDTSD